MLWRSFPNPRRSRLHSEFYDGDDNGCRYSPRRKYSRLESYQSSRQTSTPHWLNRHSSSSHSHVASQRPLAGSSHSHAASQRPLAGPSPYPSPLVNTIQCNRQTASTKYHSRIYVGNLPSRLRLPNDAYKELFSALYVTAFGSLAIGETSPVDSFWNHNCGMFGFLQMRGPKEAVNVMLFSGITLHGTKLTLGRPTGYRPEMKNLSAEEYVPSRVHSDRMEALIQAMAGILSAPTERTYIVATQQAKCHDFTESDRKTGSTSTDEEHQSKLIERTDIDPRGENKTGVADNAEGKVVVLVDSVKSFNLKDRVQYKRLVLDVRAECNNFGEVKNVVIPRKGSWVGSVFLEFGSSDDARKTVHGMRKRGFEKKAIEAYVVENCETVHEAVKRIRVES